MSNYLSNYNWTLDISIGIKLVSLIIKYLLTKIKKILAHGKFPSNFPKKISRRSRCSFKTLTIDRISDKNGTDFDKIYRVSDKVFRSYWIISISNQSNIEARSEGILCDDDVALMLKRRRKEGRKKGRIIEPEGLLRNALRSSKNNEIFHRSVTSRTKVSVKSLRRPHSRTRCKVEFQAGVKA